MGPGVRPPEPLGDGNSREAMVMKGRRFVIRIGKIGSEAFKVHQTKAVTPQGVEDRMLVYLDEVGPEHWVQAVELLPGGGEKVISSLSMIVNAAESSGMTLPSMGVFKMTHLTILIEGTMRRLGMNPDRCYRTESGGMVSVLEIEGKRYTAETGELAADVAGARDRLEFDEGLRHAAVVENIPGGGMA